MKTIFRSVVCASAVIAASFSPAWGAVTPPICVDNSGQTWASGTCGAGSSSSSFNVSYNGYGGSPVITIPGLSASATFSAFNFSTPNQVTFNISVTNTSSLSGTRLASMAFDTDPNLSGGSLSNFSPSLAQNWSVDSGGSYPVGVGTVDFCFIHTNGGGCAAGGNPNNSVAQGASYSFTATLTFAAPLQTLTFDDLFVRYNAFSYTSGGQTITSAVGGPTSGPLSPVPEPLFSSLMLTGLFGLVFWVKRRSASAR